MPKQAWYFLSQSRHDVALFLFDAMIAQYIPIAVMGESIACLSDSLNFVFV